MLSLLDAKQNFSDLNYRFFAVNGLPDIAVLLRLSSDYYYVEQLASDPKNIQNDPLIKLANSQVNNISHDLLGSIPVIGDLLNLVFSVVGIDLSIFGTLSDSADAKQSLYDWAHTLDGSQGFQKIYQSGLDFLTNDTVYPSNIQVQFSHNSIGLADARPKCVSPSSGCVTEHQRFMLRVKLLKDAQKGAIEAYLQYFNSANWNEFISENQTSGTGNTGTVPAKNLGSLALLLAVLPFIKKG